MDGMINRSFGQYTIIEPIRQGGMSTIYKAYQESLDRYVAIKVLAYNSDPQFVARFKREARAIAQLQHPNILPIYDSNEQDGMLYLVMQYIENGTTLGDLLDEPIESGRALRLIGKVLDALSYAHERGIVHRDIKPANVLLPSPDWPMLADFGIVKLRDDDQNLTNPGLVIGTAAYMAPEQASGKAVDARTDLYATGVVLYEMVTGELPFEADAPMAMLAKHAYEPPRPPRSILPSLPPEVETILLRVLEKDPAARYQSAADMAADCAQAVIRMKRSSSLQISRLYQEGVQALEEGRLDQALARFEQVTGLDPAYQDSAALLDVARSAQQRSRTQALQQLEQVRQRRRDTQEARLTAPATASPQVASAQPAESAPAAAVKPPTPAATLSPGPTATPPPMPAATPSIWVRQRVPLIIGGVLLLLAIVVLALLPSLLARPQTATNATPVPLATAANDNAPTTAAAPTDAPAPTDAAAPAAPTDAPAPTDAVLATALPALPEPAGTLAYEDDFRTGAEKSGLVGQQLAPNLALAIDPEGFYSMTLSQPNQTRWVFLPRMAAGDFSVQLDLSDASLDRTGDAAQGLVFRGRDSTHFYALLIDPRKGEYSLRKQDGADNWTDIIATKPSTLIQQQDGINQVRLDAAGDTFTLYLNGAQLDSARDSSYTFGMLGTLIANADASASTMRFDNLKIWRNDPPPRASTLPATRQNLSGDMVLISGGEFVLGSNDDPNNLPHIVAQPDFYIDSKEVTNVAYLTCADVKGCSLPKSLDSATHKGYVTTPDFNFYPIVNVSWEQASFFCEQNGKRLPTEAEWEKAASWSAANHTKTIWPWGDQFDAERLNSAEGGRGDTVAVANFRDDLNSTFDMAGNVAEWTLSLFQPYPYDPADGREDTKATGERVVRGGSWAQSQEQVGTAIRQASAPTAASNQIGFRCAATP
jgi:serine/threonine protein kinase/formylglycine-generating enzyme required for sulfatase activity